MSETETGYQERHAATVAALAAARAELAHLRGVVEAVQALHHEVLVPWGAAHTIDKPTEYTFTKACSCTRNPERWCRTLAVLAPVSSSGEAESGDRFTPADLGQEVCPTHGIPDCSPLLNGCSRLPAPSSGEAESGEAIDRVTGEPATAYTPPEDVVAPAPVSSGRQADGEGEDVRERVAQAILRHFGPPESGGGSWRLSPYKAADDVLAILAARPVLSREAIRRETFAEVSRAMNRVADIWERDGSDPCRVRVERELANAYRAYAEGYGEPTGSRRTTDVLAGGEQA